MPNSNYTRFLSIGPKDTHGNSNWPAGRGTENVLRPTEALAEKYAADAADLLTTLPGLVTQLATDITAWAGDPTTVQAGLAANDARAIAAVLERVYHIAHAAGRTAA